MNLLNAAAVSCHYCGTASLSVTRFLCHQTLYHEHLPNFSASCHSCRKPYGKVDSLRKHYQSIRQCSAYGKHPAVRVLVSPDGHVASGSNVTNACIHSEACMMDLTWALVRMPPLKLFGVDLFLSEKQTVPGWSGFNAVVISCVPVLTNIGYCPMIDGSPTEFWPRSAIV